MRKVGGYGRESARSSDRLGRMDGTVGSEEQKNPMAPTKRRIEDINATARGASKQTPEIRKRVPGRPLVQGQRDDGGGLDDINVPVKDFIKQQRRN